MLEKGASGEESVKERKQEPGGGGDWFGSGGVNICSIPAVRCQGLMKARNKRPATGGER